MLKLTIIAAISLVATASAVLYMGRPRKPKPVNLDHHFEEELINFIEAREPIMQYAFMRNQKLN